MQTARISEKLDKIKRPAYTHTLIQSFKEKWVVLFFWVYQVNFDMKLFVVNRNKRSVI